MAKMKKAQRGDTVQGYIDRTMARRRSAGMTADEYKYLIESSPTLQKIFRYSGNVGIGASRSARGTGRGTAPSRGASSSTTGGGSSSSSGSSSNTVRGFRRKTGGTIKKQPKKK